MTLIPHRTVTSQIATQLRSEMERGTWRGWLPSERALARLVQASRNTIRSALEQLKAEGLITSIRGRGYRVVDAPKRTRGGDHGTTVGVVIPEPIGRLRPLTALWIDELKDLLLEEGCRLRLHEGRHLYRTNPARALQRLVDQHPHGAWVLVLSSEPMQRWFSRRDIPCVVAGSTFQDVSLPYCDLDYRAICRHAAGVLLRAGHQRIALLNRESPRAGDVDSEAGFREGARASSRADVVAQVVYHRDDVATVERALRRLLDRPDPPTGIVVCNSYAYLAAVTLLAQRGLKVPADVSLISRDDDPFLTSVAPEPTRYVVNPNAFAKHMLGSVLQLVARERVRHGQVLMLPKYVSGRSVDSTAV